MNKSDSIKELATALSKAQAELKPVPMNAVNPFLKNKYADLGSVIESAKPVISKHGLSVTQLITNDQGWIGVTTMLMHSSGEWIESTMTLPMSEERGKSQAQVAGSMVTYIRRYAYGSILGLYTDSDDDGNGNGNGHKQQTQAQQQPQPRQEQPAQQPQQNPAEGYCQIHNCDMKRHEKDGKHWFSHRLDNGDYCNGKTTRKATA